MGCRTLDYYVGRFFYRYAHYVHRFRWLFLLAPLVLSGGLSYGLTLLKAQSLNDTEYVFTPINGRSKSEKGVLNYFWPLHNDHFIPGKFLDMKFYIELVVTAKDGGSVLRDEELIEMDKLNYHILDNFTIPAFASNRQLSYRDLCMSWEGRCYENGHLNMLLQRAQLKDFIQIPLPKGVPAPPPGDPFKSGFFRMTFPRGGRGDVPVYFGNVIGGVSVNASTKEIRAAKAIRLLYNLRENRSSLNHRDNLYSRQFMLSLEDYVLSTYHSDLISVAFAHSQSLNQGLVENSRQFIPNFMVTFILLCSFAFLCSFVILPRDVEIDEAGNKLRTSCALPRVDWVRSKPWLAMAGVMSAGMAIVSSFGLLLMLGMEYNVIASVMPFLVISIGVDDMFIMSSSWHRSGISFLFAAMNIRVVGDKTETRLARALGDAAVSISITSLTDALSFAIGCVSVLPGVWIFCAYAALAVAFDFLYQVTFFAAVMSFLGDAEAEGRHSLFFFRLEEGGGLFRAYFASGSLPFPRPALVTSPESQTHLVNDGGSSSDDSISIPSLTLHHTEETLVTRFFRDYYGPFILHPFSKLLVVLTIGLYIAGAVWGCLNIKEGLNPGNLIVKTHYLADWFKQIEILWAEGQQAHVTIAGPPQLADFRARSELLRLVRDFEANKFCMGRPATMFWLHEFIHYKEELGASLENTTEVWEEDVRYWLKYTGGRKNWEADMVWSNDTEPKLTAYRFQIGLKNFVTPNDHREATEGLREIADSYPNLNVSVYQQLFPFADQYMIILPTTLRNIGIAIGCMVSVSILLIPSISCSILITASIVSIDLGVLGYMALWNVNLDAISMICIIMSIGFAVDLTAHISYAYVKAEGATARERAITSMETLGWPVFQGAFSTIIGIMVLARVKAYMMLTFFKTVLLVISFGLIHSLLFLPVVLTLILPDSCCKPGKKAPNPDSSSACLCASQPSVAVHNETCARRGSVFVRRSAPPWKKRGPGLPPTIAERPHKRKIRPVVTLDAVQLPIESSKSLDDSWGRAPFYPALPATLPKPKKHSEKKAKKVKKRSNSLEHEDAIPNVPKRKKRVTKSKSLPPKKDMTPVE